MRARRWSKELRRTKGGDTVLCVRPGGALFLSMLLTAAPAAAEDPICADRPGKATPTCTVPAGKLQVETGIVDWLHDRSGHASSDTFSIGQSAVKFGLTDRLHLELDLTPFTQVTVHGGGLRQRVSGFGDSELVLKYRMTRADSPVQLAVRPFVKIPTANHDIGNREVEGAVAFLVDSSFSSSSVSWDIAPEVDVLADVDGSGHHPAIAGAASIGVPLSSRLTFSSEVWGSWNFDPAHTVKQYSLDGALAYLLSDRVQLDSGVNFGLNRLTPDVELYSGIAFRF